MSVTRKHWGSGNTSSSDAQFFRAGGRGYANLHYGQEPGVKFYTHLSDQFGPFHTKVLAATDHEAPHVLDGLLYHESSHINSSIEGFQVVTASVWPL
jgi:TnpA family transposase